MSKAPRVVVVGGGLAGLAAAMKLAELEVQVDLMSLTPVKRSHSVCAQGGINSVSDQTRQLGDSEWKHFDDTVYGGDFLQHQPPVKEMAEWGPKIIDLMDRLGVTFNRTHGGIPGSPPVRWHALQTNCVCRSDDGSTIAVRPGRAGSPLGDGGAYHRSTNSGISWSRSWTKTASVGVASARTCTRWRSGPFRPTPWSLRPEDAG